MKRILSFRFLFESREKRIVRFFKNGQISKLIKMGVEPELIDWNAIHSRELKRADSFLATVQMNDPDQKANRTASSVRLAS